MKGWILIALASLFISLYAAALTGLIEPPDGNKIVIRLEPVIIVIIGYCFGRLPSRQTESTLKDEISRQTQRADAAYHAREQLQQAREALEEKVKNTRVALASAAPGIAVKEIAEELSKANGAVKIESLRHAVVNAINILNS